MNFVGVDWGTNSLRAYLIDDQGEILDRSTGPDGIAHCNGEYEQTLMRHVGQWMTESEVTDIVMSGMITSKHGWVETPYLPVPTCQQAIIDALTHRRIAQELDLWFSPGIRLDRHSRTVDVIRGEETQVLARLSDGVEEELIVLPGSHSKWILVQNGEITWFSTFLTGELFGAVADHTLLRRTLHTEASSNAALREGAVLGWSGGQESGGLLHKLFTLRVRGLFEPRGSVARDMLTGLLLGSEIREATAQLDGLLPPVTVIGDSTLARKYLPALHVAGIEGRIGSERAAADGLYQLIKQRYANHGLH